MRYLQHLLSGCGWGVRGRGNKMEVGGRRKLLGGSRGLNRQKYLVATFLY